MPDVDIALLLAFDGSASVTYDEFTLMANGSAAGLRDAAVLNGLTTGPQRASLCALVLWSGTGAHDVLLDWSRVTDAASLEVFCAAVEDAPRLVRAGQTAIGEALAFCETMFAKLPGAAARKIIDMAGDGRSNEGEPPGPVRDRLVDAGVTINGLCILHEEPDLLESYQREVIGGSASFALACRDYGDFAEAMRQKLRQEVASRHRPEALRRRV